MIKRSLRTLFGAVPMGRCEGLVESLSGYFARLCLARFLTATSVYRAFVLPMCAGEFFPSDRLRIGNFLSRRSAPIDLHPESAVAFASALEHLTQLSNLRGLTFCACIPVLAPSLVRRMGVYRKRWCPGCLAGWETEGTALYEPLLWRFSFVEHCPVHRSPLVQGCPVCGGFQPVITQGVPIGYCVRCGHPLHCEVSEPLPEQGLDVVQRWSVWRSLSLSRVLAWTSTLDPDPSDRPPVCPTSFSRLLNHALACPPDGSVRSRLALSLGLAIKPSDFDRLVDGKALPQLPVLLDVCMALGVDPVRVITGEFREGERSWPPMDGPGPEPCADPWRLSLDVRESFSDERYPDRARALDAFISDPDAVDMAGLMRSIHATPPSLARQFPLRYTRALDLRAQRLNCERDSTCRRFNAALASEIAAGAPRSLGDVAASLGVPLPSLTYYSPERSAELVALRELSFSTREPGLRDRVRAALVAALDVLEGPTVHEVSRSLGVEDFVVLSLCPDEYRCLVELRERERQARYAGYAEEMRKELASPSPSSPTVLAARLGVASATLRGVDPELHAMLAAVPSERADVKRRRRDKASRVRSEEVRALRRHLVQALDRELLAPSPRSPRAVALEAGVPPSVLRHHCREQYDRLLEHRAIRRRQFLETVRGALEEEISLPQPRSLTPFARHHGVAPETLESSFPSLVAELRAVAKRVLPRPRRHHHSQDTGRSRRSRTSPS